jgi:hypothetical protein
VLNIASDSASWPEVTEMRMVAGTAVMLLWIAMIMCGFELAHRRRNRCYLALPFAYIVIVSVIAILIGESIWHWAAIMLVSTIMIQWLGQEPN